VASHPAELQDITTNGNISEVIGEDQNLNNPANWQFGWATHSAIRRIGSSIGQPIRQSQGLTVRLIN